MMGPTHAPGRAGRILLAAVALALGACGTQAPAPEEVFYRLSAGTRGAVVLDRARTLGGAIRVRRFTAESLLSQRPLVYAAEATPRQLTQYHYDSWSDEPTRMLQSLTVDALRSAGIAPEVFSSELDAYADYELDGTIKALEHRPGVESSVNLSVEFALSCDRGAELLLLQQFEQSEAAQNDSVGAAVGAFNRALARVFDALVREIGNARACRRPS